MMVKRSRVIVTDPAEWLWMDAMRMWPKKNGSARSVDEIER
jgi:hypothetical protein